jgi:hypothetical protein
MSLGWSGRGYFVDWVDAEKNAATLFYWAPILVPGLLQAESYAHTILATEPDEAESPEVLLAGRLERQRVLARPQPPAITVVMAEAVLHRGVGGPAVMYEQLTHLVEVSQVAGQPMPAPVRSSRRSEPSTRTSVNAPDVMARW